MPQRARTSRGGVHEAYRQVKHTGCVYGTQDEVMAWLRDISEYLDTKDPIELGAALLLEQAGYERSQVQLTFELDWQTRTRRKSNANR